ncbi:hypothetical protein CEXT_91221 [Caerostris extrusa]|uniref:Uncharacterized protein n=1 Tax=Caerostris extrusa TaxID=172846 RepID=A0AAV4SFU8_CAEEX|nr:hypothetical protein CEXT_91221 [Caerostris extrusa]
MLPVWQKLLLALPHGLGGVPLLARNVILLNGLQPLGAIAATDSIYVITHSRNAQSRSTTVHLGKYVPLVEFDVVHFHGIQVGRAIETTSHIDAAFQMARAGIAFSSTWMLCMSTGKREDYYMACIS